MTELHRFVSEQHTVTTVVNRLGITKKSGKSLSLFPCLTYYRIQLQRRNSPLCERTRTRTTPAPPCSSCYE